MIDEGLMDPCLSQTSRSLQLKNQLQSVLSAYDSVVAAELGLKPTILNAATLRDFELVCCVAPRISAVFRYFC
jgi:hypothetical protein